MRWAALAAYGVLLVVTPARVFRVFERLMVNNHGAVRPRPWVRPCMRAEGLLYLYALTSDSARSCVTGLSGFYGLVTLLQPRFYLDLGANLVYDDPAAVEWRESTIFLVRLLGVASLLFALAEHHPTDHE